MSPRGALLAGCVGLAVVGAMLVDDGCPERTPVVAQGATATADCCAMAATWEAAAWANSRQVDLLAATVRAYEATPTAERYTPGVNNFPLAVRRW